MVLVEFLDGRVELLTFLALNEQFCNLSASFMVLRPHFSDLAFLGSAFAPPLSGPKSVLGELTLMFVESSLSAGVPELALIVAKVLPRETNNFRESTVIRLDLGGDMLTLDKRRSE